MPSFGYGSGKAATKQMTAGREVDCASCMQVIRCPDGRVAAGLWAQMAGLLDTDSALLQLLGEYLPYINSNIVDR